MERPIREPLIALTNVSVMRGEKLVLSDINLTIDEGEHVALLGPNGCGKSTLIRTLTRELYPYGGQGAVRICGQDRWVIRELRTIIGVVSEELRTGLLGDPTGLDLAVSGLLGTFGVVAQQPITSEMWELARESLRRVDALHLELQTVETMSTGERRRCWIARALVSEPKALILDEPTNGLDLKAADEFHRIVSQLARSGITVILVTHHLEEIVPEINRVILMKDGAIVADGTRERVLQAEKLIDLFSISSAQLGSSIRSRLSELGGRS